MGSGLHFNIHKLRCVEDVSSLSRSCCSTKRDPYLIFVTLCTMPNCPLIPFSTANGDNVVSCSLSSSDESTIYLGQTTQGKLYLQHRCRGRHHLSYWISFFFLKERSL